MSRNDMEPSKFQTALYEWVRNGFGHGVCEAKAGSGKTTTATTAIAYIPRFRRVGFVAFNRGIANELKKRVPSYCDALTLHSLGFRAWGRFVGRRLEVESGKTRKIMDQTMSKIESIQHGGVVRRLVGIAKAHGLVPDEIEGATGLIPDTQEVWEALIERFDLDVDAGSLAATQIKIDQCIALARAILVESCRCRFSLIDFDDQLYLPVIFNAPFPAYDWLFVDEAQDLSSVQQVMVERSIVPGTGRILAIGDSHQAIYGFRGAGTGAMDMMRKRLRATSLDLSICYRCPRSHIKLAQTIVPGIEASPYAQEGEIQRLGQKWDYLSFYLGDLIICRAGAPLVKVAYKLLNQRVPVQIMGRELGAGLVDLIMKLKPDNLHDLQEKLSAWHERQVDRIRLKDPEASTDTVDDKRECIETFISLFPNAEPEELCAEIQKLYDEKREDDVVRLATIHKAKGLEADRVWILNQEISDYLMRKVKRPWMQEQERNLLYVAYTRSRKFLGFIEIDLRGKEKRQSAERDPLVVVRRDGRNDDVYRMSDVVRAVTRPSQGSEAERLLESEDDE